MTGTFAEPERSARAAALTRAWECRWSTGEPVGWMLRQAHPDRWVRFHSLPALTAQATTAAERGEMQRRHLTVLRDLPRDGGLVVIADDFAGEGRPDAGFTDPGWAQRLRPDAWPWRHFAEPGPELLDHWFWSWSCDDVEGLVPLLEVVRDAEVDAIITTSDAAWIYAPYYAGADVILPDAAMRDVLRERHRGWLSPLPSGL
ncbi:hypothetical protein PU630_01545 [Microbacterium horticulturae]|uniref:DUF3885 domain-containing protein n=1 Tax=Microbacterium horticulturae TaxID=3028316 RepID=A0ABY8C0L5_9MICO|nr:hypothetical protein [Microbacterium sp. KACC 23027]WEG09272.1 hypothetical protein PU630_01545 [Microbacterium sp. KACC 23027]